MPEENPAARGAGDGTDPRVPSVLDLIRLSRRDIFPPGSVDLYRHIAVLTNLSRGQEVLDVACGLGVHLQYWVTEYEVQGSGIDGDPAAIARAEKRAREAGLSERLQFQEGSPENLPYRDAIFDVVVGEMGLSAQSDPAIAIQELVRVAKPGGAIVLVQLVWKAPVDPIRRAVLSSHLGARPLMLVELKRILREEGVGDLHTEDWSDEETAFRRQVTKPFPDFSDLFSGPEKLAILRRAWRRWGWEGVRKAVRRQREVHRLLTRERIIGLDLLTGRKAPAAGSVSAVPEGAASTETTPDKATPEKATPEKPTSEDGVPEEATRDENHGETVGLPLFGREGSE